jgi:integrase
MNAIRRKRGGWTVVDKATRHQLHQGIFKTKKEAEECRDKIVSKQAETNPSKLTFKTAFKQFVEYRSDIASDPSIALTKAGVGNYKSDWSLRIEPFMTDCLLSDFKADQMKDLLRKCHKAGYEYKTLERMVRNIKTFLREMSADSKNPCLDMLQFQINTFHEIIPADHGKRYEKETVVIDDKNIERMLQDLAAKKDMSFDAAYRFALICILFLFGLRRAEIKALQPSDVDFEHNFLRINKTYNDREGGLLKRTKNKGSFRNIDADDKALKFFTWWIKTVKKYKPNTKWLYPAFRGDNPISDKGISNLMWSTYAEYGLAKIQWHRGHIRVISSPLKGAVMKTFRHNLATKLINDLYAGNLNPNYVKSVVGHSRFQTTQDRYGNHNMKASKALTSAKSKALGTKLIKI